jgi:hypothetical protein
MEGLGAGKTLVNTTVPSTVAVLGSGPALSEVTTGEVETLQFALAKSNADAAAQLKMMQLELDKVKKVSFYESFTVLTIL